MATKKEINEMKAIVEAFRIERQEAADKADEAKKNHGMLSAEFNIAMKDLKVARAKHQGAKAVLERLKIY